MKIIGSNGYFSAEAIERHGKKLILDVNNPPTAEQVGGLTLVAIVDNGAWRIAGDVSNPIGMKAHLDSLKSGRWKTMELYAVAEDKLPLCEDKGREPSRYSDKKMEL